MSYDLNVYLLKARLPSAAALHERLQRSRVSIEKPLDLATTRGFLPVLLDGQPTGFEIRGSEITARRRESYSRRAPDVFLEILTTCNFDLGLTCKTARPAEIEAARIVATSIAAIAGGWFFDPQTSETIRFRTPR